MATNVHGEKNQIFGKNTDQISRKLDLRSKHIGFKASQMKFKGFSGPPMQFKAFLRQPPNSRPFQDCMNLVFRIASKDFGNSYMYIK